jgi:small GTP-binding protein
VGLSVGIVGLPNSGKSTLFNALLKRQIANVASYPFTTIEPNVGIVEVPDERLKKLAAVIAKQQTTRPQVVPATIRFIDIAGLVKNAHQGEGLGNQFLAKIREVEAVVHIIRGFEDGTTFHYYGSIDPQRDKEIVDLELELAGIKKPTLYVLNRGDRGNQGDQEDWKIEVNAKTGEGVEELIKKTYELLGLISFYTIKGGKEVTAWSIKKGSTAWEAAGKVHTEMAKGFIKAEVVKFEDLIKAGGWNQARSLGKIQLVGRDYLIEDGDVVEFKFSG